MFAKIVGTSSTPSRFTASAASTAKVCSLYGLRKRIRILMQCLIQSHVGMGTKRRLRSSAPRRSGLRGGRTTSWLGVRRVRAAGGDLRLERVGVAPHQADEYPLLLGAERLERTLLRQDRRLDMLL